MIAVPKVGARVAVMMTNGEPGVFVPHTGTCCYVRYRMPNATVDLSGRWVKQVSLVESARAAIVSVLLDKPIMGGRHRLVRASLPQLASAGEEVFAICDRCQIPYAFGGFQRDAIDCDQHHRMLTQPRYSNARARHSSSRSKPISCQANCRFEKREWLARRHPSRTLRGSVPAGRSPR